jgi:hypothetical protein
MERYTAGMLPETPIPGVCIVYVKLHINAVSTDVVNYHQDYLKNNPNNPYIVACDLPKLAALKKDFPDLYRDY